MRTFDKSFTQQEPIPEAGIERAIEVMRSGRLHRYNTLPSESWGEAGLLEQEFADYVGSPYCLTCASGGYALHIALKSLGLETGAPVLSNAFTLSPVPGAINNAGGRPILVETTENYTVDVDDLRRAAIDSGARIFMLSHMRGHIGDMEAIGAVCEEYGVTLVEDCAHTMGARWRGQMSGTFGRIGCFSTQTYKHVNSGEGGLLITSDAEVMRRAIIYSGSYMFYHMHPAAPAADSYSERRLDTPNYSGRMDNLRAAITRPQLAEIEQRRQRWNELYAELEQGLSEISEIRLPSRPPEEEFVGSSIQFSLPQRGAQSTQAFVGLCQGRGVAVKWFGDSEPRGYTSRYDSWRYLHDMRPLPRTREVLAGLCDMRIPLTFTLADCRLIVEIIRESLNNTSNK